MSRMLSLTLLLLSVFVLVVLTGCPSFSTLHTAESVEEGESEVMVSAGYIGAGVSDAQGDTGGGSLDIPTFEIGARHGLAEDVDVGAKVYPVGAAFDVNYTFINVEEFAMSVNPYLGITRFGFGGESFSYGFALINVLADVVRTDVLALTVGLKPGTMYGFGGGEAGFAPVIGGMAGVDLALSDSFSVMPSFDVIFPFANFGGDAVVNTTMYTGGLSFHF